MTRLSPLSVRRWLSMAWLACAAQLALAQQPVKPEPLASGTGAVEWLQRMHAASCKHSYVGTFVVSAATGDLSSARIWHTCDGNVQIERVEALTGPQRSTFRRNEQVMTFWPEARIVKTEKRESQDLFPNLPGAPDSSMGDVYGMRMLGKDRVAGIDADVVALVPRDDWRFGYRVWTERRSGLLVKLQTLDAGGRVVEQSAFSELQLDVQVKAQALAQMMEPPAGYRVEKSGLERTSAGAEGWTFAAPVPGFRATGCYRRSMASPFPGQQAQQPQQPRERIVQCTFSDGLASVSLFVEPHDARRQPREGMLALGATYTMTRRLTEGGGDWWLTAVGEVPPRTLEAFARSLVRAR